MWINNFKQFQTKWKLKSLSTNDGTEINKKLLKKRDNTGLRLDEFSGQWVRVWTKYWLDFAKDFSLSTAKATGSIFNNLINHFKKAKYHFGPYILRSRSIWSLHFGSSQYGPYYFQLSVNLVPTVNSLTKNA